MKCLVPGPLAALIALLDEFGPVQRAGNEFRCYCPAHDDKGPSLYVGLGHEPGHLVANCKAGCSFMNVAAALKIDPMEAFYFDPDGPMVEVEVDGRGPSPRAHANGNGKVEGAACAAPVDAALCDRVYTELMSGQDLSDGHRGDLRRRGLTDEAIDRLGYKTSSKYHLNQAVGRIRRGFEAEGIRDDTLLQVPGFGRRLESIRFYDTAGLLIPIRDERAKIVAIKVRRDADVRPKYVYASGCEGGASCGSPCHVPLGTPAQATTCRVTEGELKADICFILSGMPTLGVAGVGSWARAVPVLRAMGVETVVLAFDADYRTNEGVSDQLTSCAAGLVAEGFRVRYEVWDPAAGKGLDDLLAAGGKPEVMEALPESEEAPPPAEEAPAEAPTKVPSGPPSSGVHIGGLDGVEAFPVDVFPGPVAKHVKAVARSMRCPVDFPGVGVLSVATGAIGGARRLRLKSGYVEPCIDYVAVVAPPGSIKTPALDEVCGPVRRRQYQLSLDYEEAKNLYGEALRKYEEAKQKGEALPPKPTRPVQGHSFVGDVTIERAGEILHGTPRGVLQIKDELTAWALSMDMYRGGRGTDRQFYLSNWSGVAVKIDRKTEGRESLIIPRPNLSVLGGIPPNKLHLLDAGNNGDDGFVHRILFCYPDVVEDRSWTWEGIEEEAGEEWERVVTSLYALAMDRDRFGHDVPKVIELAEKARPFWAKWHNLHTGEMGGRGFDPVLIGPWAKMISHTARLAIPIHLLRVVCGEASSEDVDPESLKRAMTLAKYFKSHARRVYAQLNQSPMSARIERALLWILSKGGKVGTRDLTRNNVAGVGDRADAVLLMKELEDRGYGTCSSDTGKNHKSALWFTAFPLKADAKDHRQS